MTQARPAVNPLRRRIAIALPLLGTLATTGLHARPADVLLRRSLPLMGTRVDIVVDAASQPIPVADADQAMAAAMREMQQLAARMSRYDPASDVSRLRDQAGIQPVALPPAVLRVLQAAHDLAQFTGGAFDATVGALSAWHFEPGANRVPASEVIHRQRQNVQADALRIDHKAGTAFLAHRGMALDLGGVAKLPILEAGLATLRTHGIENALVNGGGDVLVTGLTQGRPWRIGVRDPQHPAQLLGTIALAHGGIVASSGDYERGFWHEGRRMHHILDPRTGYPTQGIHGVAMVAATVAEVNGLGAAAMVQGLQRAPALFARRPGVHALLVGSTSSWNTPALQNLGKRTAAFQWRDGQLQVG